MIYDSLPFQPACHAGNGAEMPADCAAKVLVILEHQDTLGRPLPEGIRVEVRDSRLKRYVGVTDAEGVSQHPGVIAGLFSWQLLDAPGRHLVAVDDQPVHPVAAGLGAPEAKAVMHETTVTATYLPPPILIDLHTPPGSGADRLSDAQLEQLRLAGASATLFVHGYNVARGDWARFSPQADGADNGGPFLFGEPLLRPSGDAAIATLCQSQATDADTHGLNGSGACSWLASMELQLNRAAGLTDDDWRPYSRVVGIAWPGDTGSTDFVEAEFSAMQSGRRLVTVLGQLIDAKLSINIVSHSLGARVVLSALNILGDRISGQCIDNLFLWEPAVADNALSPDSPFTAAALKGGYDEGFDQASPGRETHPLGMGTFPMAHRSAKNIVVLHSREDGILGPNGEDAAQEWAEILDPSDWLDDVAAFVDATQDDRLGELGGAYPKKWWTFPPLLAGGLGYFRDYYFERARALGGDWEDALSIHLHQRARNEPHIQYRIERAWDALERAIIDEARRVAATSPDARLDPSVPLPDYDLLKPLSHHYKVGELMAERFAQRLRLLGQRDNWQPRDRRVRPALGLVGFKKVEDVPFFKRRIDRDIFEPIDQSTWLFAHSAMKYPTEEIFIKSYQDGIMKAIKGSSRFGRY
ncbi:MAG TPA: alpha/beta hydrolase [Modicisalibacter sp.]|nr:alpha/beta hydrolase [Modicisalibacter sp.]